MKANNARLDLLDEVRYLVIFILFFIIDVIPMPTTFKTLKIVEWS